MYVALVVGDANSVTLVTEQHCFSGDKCNDVDFTIYPSPVPPPFNGSIALQKFLILLLLTVLV